LRKNSMPATGRNKPDAVMRGANDAGYFRYATRIGKPLSSLGQDTLRRARRALGGRQFDEEPRSLLGR
jgi:hypothetical protein